MTDPFCLHASIGDTSCNDQCADCYRIETEPHWARRPVDGATLLHLVADDTDLHACCGAYAPGSREPWQPASQGLPKCENCSRLGGAA